MNERARPLAGFRAGSSFEPGTGVAMRYTISTATAREAVHPTPLVDVLKSLRDNGVVRSFAIHGDQLVLDMDPGVEIPFILDETTRDPRMDGGAWRGSAPSGSGVNRDRVAGSLEFETTRAYYARAEAFTHTAAFRRLSPHRRAIWRLHARGMTKYEIADELCCPSGSVARAVLMIRPQAGLPRTERTIPRGRRQNRRTN